MFKKSVGLNKGYPVTINLENRIKIGLETINAKIPKRKHDPINRERTALYWDLSRSWNRCMEVYDLFQKEFKTEELGNLGFSEANDAELHQHKCNLFLCYYHIEYAKIIYFLSQFLFEANPAMKDYFKNIFDEEYEVMYFYHEGEYVPKTKQKPKFANGSLRRPVEFIKLYKRMDQVTNSVSKVLKETFDSNLSTLKEIFLRFETQNSQIVRNALATKHYFNKRPWRSMPEKLNELASVENYDKFVRNPIQRLSI